MATPDRDQWIVVSIVLQLGRAAPLSVVAGFCPQGMTEEDVTRLCALEACPFRLNRNREVELVTEEVEARCEMCRSGHRVRRLSSKPRKNGVLQPKWVHEIDAKLLQENGNMAYSGLWYENPTTSAEEAAAKDDISYAAPVFSDYVVEGERGSGRYATVYKVKRKRDGRIFAMKCPYDRTPDSYIKNEIAMLQKFRAEQFVIQLESEVQDDRARSNILMRYQIHDSPEGLRDELTVTNLRSLSFGLFTALACLHKQSVAHGDINPSNYLFSKNTYQGRLIDFNLAMDVSRLSDETEVARTLQAGTRGYRAPEVLIGCRPLSTKLDIWSAGVTMMNLICGLGILPPSNNEQALRDVAALVGVEKVMALADAHAHDMNVGEILQGVNRQPICTNWREHFLKITFKSTEEKDEWPDVVFHLIGRCLEINPEKRIDAEEALNHEFLASFANHYSAALAANTSQELSKEYSAKLGRARRWKEEWGRRAAERDRRAKARLAALKLRQ